MHYLWNNICETFKYIWVLSCDSCPWIISDTQITWKVIFNKCIHFQTSFKSNPPPALLTILADMDVAGSPTTQSIILNLKFLKRFRIWWIINLFHCIPSFTASREYSHNDIRIAEMWAYDLPGLRPLVILRILCQTFSVSNYLILLFLFLYVSLFFLRRLNLVRNI